MTYVLGTDIHSLSRPTDWNAVVDAGVKFMFIKASENTFPDNYIDRRNNIEILFSDTWQRAKDTGVLHGPYHFFHPETNTSAQQAKVFIETVGADKGELPPILDLENIFVNKVAIPLPVGNTMLSRIKDWLDRVEQAFGRKPIIYSREEFLRSHGIHASWLADYPLWLAQYPWMPGTQIEYKDPNANLTASPRMPTQPEGYQPWLFWQWSAHGRMHGFPANQDVDFDYFNGTYDDLLRFAGIAAPKPATTTTTTTITSTTTTTTSSTASYTVAAGDTLSSIAVKFNISLAELVNLNAAVLIKPGMQLTVPAQPTPGGGPTHSVASVGGTSATSSVQTFDYVVKPNDTLGGIALKFQTTVPAILALNPQITNPNIIIAGSTIKIPKV